MDALLMRIGQEIGLLLLVGLAVIALAVPLIFWRQRHMTVTAAIWKTALEGAIVGSLAIGVVLTLTQFANGGRGQVSLVPFQSIFDTMALGDFWVGLALVDMAGNFLLFMPLGLAVSLRFVRLRLLLWVLVAVVLSLVIEGAQLFALNRSADITDVIMNASGAVAGFLIGRAVRSASRRIGNAAAST